MTIRVGIVGANPDYGWGSGVHRRVIESLPGIALHRVCTTREDSARKAAAVFGAPIWTTSHEDLSAHSEIDVIAICVKAPFHYEIAKAALQAGKHVYCEWPLAITVAQAEELAALAASGGARTITGLHLRGSPVMRQAARMIAEGFVGRVYSVSLHARLFGPVMRAMALRSGGTTLHSIYGGHLLDGLTIISGVSPRSPCAGRSTCRRSTKRDTRYRATLSIMCSSTVCWTTVRCSMSISPGCR